jgi:hypothetical protein
MPDCLADLFSLEEDVVRMPARVVEAACFDGCEGAVLDLRGTESFRPVALTGLERLAEFRPVRLLVNPFSLAAAQLRSRFDSRLSLGAGGTWCLY